jgi:MbtH protein
MPKLENQDNREYVVVKNEEDQFSIYFADRELPPGWQETSQRGQKAECLDYIKEVWTDMTPRSLREQTAPGTNHNGAGEPKGGSRSVARVASKKKVGKKTSRKKGTARRSPEKKS